jgi:hypothetical protein
VKPEVGVPTPRNDFERKNTATWWLGAVGGWLVVPPLKIFFPMYFDCFNAVFRLLAAVAHDVCETLSLWVHSGWACRRGARRMVLNRREPRRLAFPPVGPTAVDRLDLQPPYATAIGVKSDKFRNDSIILQNE